MGIRIVAILCLALLAGAARAQEGAAASPASGAEPPGPEWSFSASAYLYLVPDGQNYVQPTLGVDRGWLHLEARYDYEDLKTGSAWVGASFHVGDQLSLAVTPMLGGVFGRTNGIAPGCKLSLDWWRLALYTEGEYVVDTDASADSFFYSWSELTLSPLDWLRVGLVAQRTRAYRSELELQRGFLVGLTLGRLGLTAHVFDPGQDQSTVVVSAAVEF